MSDRKFGWDLPPGCSISDIPGNRPEDEAWEKIMDAFYSLKFTDEEGEVLAALSERQYELLVRAIEYGIELGTKQPAVVEQEAAHYQSVYRTKQVSEFCNEFRNELLNLLERIAKGQEGDAP